MSNQVLTMKDVREAGWRWQLKGIGTFGYETQLAPTNVYALRKALRKLYPNDEDYKTAMHNHAKYFNTQPYMSSVVMGVALAMEEQLGIEGKDAIQNFKAGLMGPLAGVGDTLFWIVLPAIFTPIEAALANQGSVLGILITLVKAIALAVARLQFFPWGYKMGTSAISGIKDKMALLTDTASVLGLVVLGALIPGNIGVTCGLSFTTPTGSQVVIQSFLDMICPKLLPLALTFGAATLLGKKKVKITTLVLIVLLVSIVASFTNLLA